MEAKPNELHPRYVYRLGEHTESIPVEKGLKFLVDESEPTVCACI